VILQDQDGKPVIGLVESGNYMKTNRMGTALKILKEVENANKSDIIKPKPLADESVTMLTARLKDEYNAHFFYRNAANWCQEKAYLKAAAFFEQESANENEHALKVQKYLVDWNVYPTLPSLKPTITFNNLIEIISKAYALEYGLYESYNADSIKLMTTDIATFDFLQELRIGQRESITEYSDLLNAAELVNVENNFEVLYFEQTYF